MFDVISEGSMKVGRYIFYKKETAQIDKFYSVKPSKFGEFEPEHKGTAKILYFTVPEYRFRQD